jgi:hypothetical protein
LRGQGPWGKRTATILNTSHRTGGAETTLTTLREAKAILDWHLGRARWIFIHIPKNAGVSVRKSPHLAGKLISAERYFHKSRAYTQAVEACMSEAGAHHGHQHARWRDLDPKVTSRLQAVAVVRNPWARTYSRWRFARYAEVQGKGGGAYENVSFEEFLEERHVYGDRDYYWHRAVRGWFPQRDYVTDEAGNLVVDLLRFEALDDESTRYFDLPEPVRKRNVTRAEHEDYRQAYSERMIDIIADWYREDIETFGFDFDTPATRNTVFS